MLELRFEEYRIEVANDDTFTLNSADNIFQYDKIYRDTDDDGYFCSRHAIRVFDGDELSEAALVYASGGATTVHANSAVVMGDSMFICCGNKILSLFLPGLELRWIKEADWACCFQVFEYEGDLIVQGEMQVCRMDTSGEKKWSRSFADITVTPDGSSSFRLEKGFIEVVDWELNRYEVCYETGKFLATYMHNRRDGWFRRLRTYLNV